MPGQNVVIRGVMYTETTDAHPEHPIVIPPLPPSGAHPEHPIVLPPEQPPLVPPNAPKLPVYKTVPVQDGMEEPTGGPSKPGEYIIVYVSKSNKRALGWMNGPSVWPDQPKPEQPIYVGGHWVTVQKVSTPVCGKLSADDCAWAYVFEVGADYGK